MMPTDFTFRFSTYLTLGLACGCLGYAEREYLPEVTVFAVLIGVALLVSFRAEGKFAMSLTAANWVGAGIFVVAGVWIAGNWRRENSLLHTLPWPAGLLPFLAPLLMVLIPAKLFRPKHVGDWWAMHGVGLSSVALAGSLAEDAGYILLLAGYAACGVWSLSVFFHRRAAGLIPPVPAADGNSWLDVGAWFPLLAGSGRNKPPVVSATGNPNRYRPGRWTARRPLAWLAVALVFALPLFFVTPRSGDTRWALGGRMETGYAPDNAIDLTRTGTLKDSRETAFDVEVRDAAGNLKDDLSADARWRGQSYSDYENGKWARGSVRRIFAPAANALPTQPATYAGVLPDLGPEQVQFDFRLTDRVRGVVLADPVAYDPAQPGPLLYELGNRQVNGMQNWDGSFVPFLTGTARISRYKQVTRPLPDPGLGVPFRQAESPPGEDVFSPLRKSPGPGLSAYARKLFDRLVKEGKIPAAVAARRDPIKLNPADRDNRVVAEAFRDFLSGSGEFGYSLTLVRGDKAMDPIEDFLVNVRTGHCERFAAGLTVLCRGVGIPAQFILGFKGCEGQGDGKYVVRQEHAHAWVEALVPAGDGRWQWLTLDPTPADAAPDPPTGVGGLWDSAVTNGKQFFNDYVVGLNPANQKRAAAAAKTAATDYGPPTAVAGVGLLLTFLALRVAKRFRRRPAAAAPPLPSPVPWFAAMAAALAARGRPFPPGQTPREYAAEAAAWLASDPATAAVADVPGAAADAVYAARYAGGTLDPAAAAELERAVARLIAALPPVPGT